MWTAVEELHRSGRSLLYSGPLDSPAAWGYALLTIVVLDYAHDTWFYWTHRLLHWGPVYRHVHAIHHQSRVPTAFTGYSFHVAEAALVFANEVIVCFCMPIHMGLHRVYHLYNSKVCCVLWGCGGVLLFYLSWRDSKSESKKGFFPSLGPRVLPLTPPAHATSLCRRTRRL